MKCIYWNKELRREITVIVGRETELRLHGTCFRGKDVARAGNFARWENSRDLFDDDRFRDLLFGTIARKMSEPDFCPSGFAATLAYQKTVGWSSTMPRRVEGTGPNVCEPYRPNKHTTTMRVRTDRTDILAPKTMLVSLSMSQKRGRDPDGERILLVHTIYPGTWIGPLHQQPGEPITNGVVDLTAARDIVFFDWNHPGHPL